MSSSKWLNSFFIGYISCVVTLCVLVLIIIFCCLNRDSVKRSTYTQTDKMIDIPIIVLHPNNEITLTN